MRGLDLAVDIVVIIISFLLEFGMVCLAVWMLSFPFGYECSFQLFLGITMCIIILQYAFGGSRPWSK